MTTKTKRLDLRALTTAGLLVAALGIAVLWATGVDFPVAVPPGIVILVVGALVVALVRTRWTLAVGAFLGAFILVGFWISPDGRDNLTGDHGAAVSSGQAIEVVGALVALVAGSMATRAAYRAAT